MRRKVKNRNIVKPDIKFSSTKVEKFINYVMEQGKKNAAREIVYGAFELVKEKTKSTDALEVFEQALRNVGPAMEVRSRRVGGANYQVPVEVRPKRKEEYSMKWIIAAARSGKGKPMAQKLSDEIILASKNEGSAVTKRENVHKMAEANKAFAHFAW